MYAKVNCLHCRVWIGSIFTWYRPSNYMYIYSERVWLTYKWKKLWSIFFKVLKSRVCAIKFHSHFAPLFIEYVQCARHWANQWFYVNSHLNSHSNLIKHTALFYTQRINPELREIKQLAQGMLQNWNLNPDCLAPWPMLSTIVFYKF